MTARDREADLIAHVRTHETCTPECDDFRRLLERAVVEIPYSLTRAWARP